MDQIIYHDDDHAVLTSTNKGKDAPAHFRTAGQPRSLRFKAVNSLSCAPAKDDSQASRSFLFRQSDVASAQRAFLAKVERADIQGTSPRHAPTKNKDHSGVLIVQSCVDENIGEISKGIRGGVGDGRKPKDFESQIGQIAVLMEMLNGCYVHAQHAMKSLICFAPADLRLDHNR